MFNLIDWFIDWLIDLLIVRSIDWFDRSTSDFLLCFFPALVFWHLVSLQMDFLQSDSTTSSQEMSNGGSQSSSDTLPADPPIPPEASPCSAVPLVSVQNSYYTTQNPLSDQFISSPLPTAHVRISNLASPPRTIHPAQSLHYSTGSKWLNGTTVRQTPSGFEWGPTKVLWKFQSPFMGHGNTTGQHQRSPGRVKVSQPVTVVRDCPYEHTDADGGAIGSAKFVVVFAGGWEWANFQIDAVSGRFLAWSAVKDRWSSDRSTDRLIDQLIYWLVAILYFFTRAFVRLVLFYVPDLAWVSIPKWLFSLFLSSTLFVAVLWGCVFVMVVSNLRFFLFVNHDAFFFFELRWNPKKNMVWIFKSCERMKQLLFTAEKAR